MQQTTGAQRPDNFDIEKVIKELPQCPDSLDQVVGTLYPGCDSSVITEEEIESLNKAVYRCINKNCGFWNKRSDMSDVFELCNECRENESSYIKQ